MYVHQRQAAGIGFTKGSKTYLSFLRRTGNLPLRQINIEHVVQFLTRYQGSVAAFRRVHSLLNHFFEYWAANGEIAAQVMPASQPPQRSRFLAYIFSKEELKRLLQSAPQVTTANDTVHPKTIRAAVLTLYATGATVGEVARLTSDDVNLNDGSIKLSGSRLKAGRSIPIANDLIRVMQQYTQWKPKLTPSKWFFPRVDGRPISPRLLRSSFERLRRKAGISGYRESSQRPCLRDLRATFAVHRITSWMKRKEKLNVMLPALAVYLGNVALESTERYLQLTPQRFQSVLNKLSPQSARIRWREDPRLLEFLTSL